MLLSRAVTRKPRSQLLTGGFLSRYYRNKKPPVNISSYQREAIPIKKYPMSYTQMSHKKRQKVYVKMITDFELEVTPFGINVNEPKELASLYHSRQ